MKRYFKIILLLTVLLAISCKQNERKTVSDENTTHQLYTCSMHPQIVKDEMGICPICAMDLVPFSRDNNDKQLKIDEQRELLANIQTQKVMYGGLSKNNRTYQAKLIPNVTQSFNQTAKIAGRIEKLYIKETGVYINKGQALYQVYSEELAALQNEYLLAIHQQSLFENSTVERKIVEASEHKLLLYGFTAQQIIQLRQSKLKINAVTVYADKSGIVSNLLVRQGQYLEIGSPILSLENQNQLWVEALIPPDDAAKFKLGNLIKVSIGGWEDEVQLVPVDFVSPIYQNGSQLVQIRGTISNKHKKWYAGMLAKIWLETTVNQNNKELILPINALIQDGKGKHIWIKTSKHTYEAKKIEIKNANSENVQIVSGLNEGAEVVINGAYLLYSEYQLRKGKHPLGK